MVAKRGAKKGSKQNGRSHDTTLAWLTEERGELWEEWRTLMTDWMATRHQGLNLRMKALVFFAMEYLPKMPNGH